MGLQGKREASDHKFSTGTYHVHLYYIQGDGSQVGVGGTTVQVENRNFVTRISSIWSIFLQKMQMVS